MDGHNQDWSPIGADQPFSAFVGLPVANVSTGNSTFSLQSSHIVLSCDDMSLQARVNASEYPKSLEVPTDQTTLQWWGFNISGPAFTNGTWYSYPGTKDPSVSSSKLVNPGWSLALDRFADSIWSEEMPVSMGEYPAVGKFEKELGIEAGQTNLLFQSVRLTNWDRPNANATWELYNTECRVIEQYVESQVACSRTQDTTSQPACRVLAQRASREPRPSTNISMLSDATAFGVVSKGLPALNDNLGYSPSTDAILFYLYNENLAEYLGSRENPDFTDVSAANFSTRLSQIINSYIHLDQINPLLYHLWGDINAEDIGGQLKVPVWQQEQATTEDLLYVYLILWPWAIVCIASCLALALSGVLSVVYAHKGKGPEMLGFVSTVVRESRHVDMPHSLGHVDGPGLSRIWKKLRFRYGRVRADTLEDHRLGIGHERDVPGI